MKTIRRALGAGAVAALLAACGGSPTGAAAEASDASLDGGFTIGSGNREASSDSTMTTPATVAPDPTARGGYTMGSGN